MSQLTQRQHLWEIISVWDNIYLRQQLFETTTVKDNICVIQQLYETTAIWDNNCVRKQLWQGVTLLPQAIRVFLNLGGCAFLLIVFEDQYYLPKSYLFIFIFWHKAYFFPHKTYSDVRRMSVDSMIQQLILPTVQFYCCVYPCLQGYRGKYLRPDQE